MHTPATPASPNNMGGQPAGRSGQPGQPPRKIARLLPRLLIGGVVLSLLLYAALWGYQFAVSQLGPFAPLTAGFVLALIVAVGGPWLLVRERRRLEPAV